MDKEKLYMYLKDYLDGLTTVGLTYRELEELSFFIREYLKIVAQAHKIDVSRPWFLGLVSKDNKRSSLRTAIDILIKLALMDNKPTALYKSQNLNGYFNEMILDFNKAMQGATSK